MYATLKRLYGTGQLSEQGLRKAVEVNGWITAEQYEEITGEPYSAE